MDARQLETLFQFSKFLELVSNPQELRTFLKDAKDVLEKQQAQLGLFTTKQKADALLLEAEQINKATKEQREKANKEIAYKQAEAKDACNSIVNDLSKEQAKVQEAKAKALEDQTIAHSFLQQAKEKFEMVVEKEQRLFKQEQDLAKKEKDLQEKSDKLKQLLAP